MRYINVFVVVFEFVLVLCICVLEFGLFVCVLINLDLGKLSNYYW